MVLGQFLLGLLEHARHLLLLQRLQFKFLLVRLEAEEQFSVHFRCGFQFNVQLVDFTTRARQSQLSTFSRCFRILATSNGSSQKQRPDLPALVEATTASHRHASRSIHLKDAVERTSDTMYRTDRT